MTTVTQRALAVVLGLLFTTSTLAQAPTRFHVEIGNVSENHLVLKSGAFTTPTGAAEPGPLFPGDTYTFSFTAPAGMRLSFATMFVQSNDLFFAPDEFGLPLFVDGTPRTGDVTDEVLLWDAGSEVDEEPGVGPNQAPRQSAPDTGTDENGDIVLVTSPHNGFDYPDIADVIRVTLDHDGTAFTVTIENVSDENTLATSEGSVAVPLSPGVWAVHRPTVRFFEPGTGATDGLEGIAEDGSVDAALAEITPMTGLTTPLSPGAFAVHPADISFFEPGSAASAGIERIAEDGDPSAFPALLAGIPEVRRYGVFNTPVGADSPAPIGPGGSYAFEVTALPGDYLSFATMFVQSNDLFLAPDEMGIALFTDGTPRGGDVTGEVMLWDAGTEVDEEPGVGPNQAPRQSAPDTGTDEGGVILAVTSPHNGYTYPAVEEVVRVTLTPVETTPFVVRIENVSDENTLATSEGSVAVPLSPGAWAVHGPSVDFFETGAAASAGLEAVAEDGDPAVLSDELRGAMVVQSGVFDTPAGATGPGPLFPGGVYEFDLEAAPGDYLSLATMFVQSNDLFFAPDPSGVPLFADGTPREGDITAELLLWDAGTEVDEEPGVGPNQAPRQSAPDTGTDEGGVIVAVTSPHNGFSYPATSAVIRVTLLANTSVGTEPGSDLPLRHTLGANYPNPFNPSTTIPFELAEAGHVQLQIVDVLGRHVQTLVDAVQPAGTYRASWNARDEAGRSVASGLYLYRLTIDGRTAMTRTMLLVK